jgi:trehalose/maltose transport system substrate-binding protein
METMAAAVQAGERTRGRKGFWGFVWQGAAYEGLTCNALEWQMSEGGGAILDEDGTITVNNPHAVRAWARAARWVGWISPPGVIAYLEMDAHSLWESGNACFMRGWPSSYATSAAEGSAVKGRFDVVALPAGRGGRASAMGENALAVSRYSRWPREATALVRYLTRPDVQRWRARTTALWPTLPDLYEDPELLKTDPYYPRLKEVLSRYAAVRPSTAAGKKYPEVSAAYARTVHSVLTGQKSAAAAAAALETELAGMGFRPRAADRGR